MRRFILGGLAAATLAAAPAAAPAAPQRLPARTSEAGSGWLSRLGSNAGGQWTGNPFCTFVCGPLVPTNPTTNSDPAVRDADVKGIVRGAPFGIGLRGAPMVAPIGASPPGSHPAPLPRTDPAPNGSRLVA